ncbi:MAG: antitoxin [Candidatus Leucobacter sulfamidivorax]|nr:antitoxin [Candidatus Leucobacter sulfamidivorax]
MIATIDKAGRLVIPKPLRDAMGLKPGVPLDLSYSDGQIVIEYAPVAWRVETMNGFPVIRSDRDPEAPPLTDAIVRETLEAVRDEGV